MKNYAILLLALVLVSCRERVDDKTPVDSPPPTPPPIVLDAPATFSMQQRTTTALPGSNGKVLMTIDDITKDQVMTTLSWQNGSLIVATRSLSENDVVTFTASNHLYRIKLKKLKNVLVRKDSAEFQLWPVTDE